MWSQASALCFIPSQRIFVGLEVKGLGRKLVTLSYDETYVFSRWGETGKRLNPRLDATSYALSPCGRLLVGMGNFLGGCQGNFDFTSGTCAMRRVADFNPPEDIAWHLMSSSCVYASTSLRGVVSVVDSLAGRCLWQCPRSWLLRDRCFSPIWSPDGTSLAALARSSSTTIFSFDSTELSLFSLPDTWLVWINEGLSWMVPHLRPGMFNVMDE